MIINLITSEKIIDELLRFSDPMYSASKISFIVALRQLHLFLHRRFNHILNLKGRLLPLLRFGPPEITVPPVSIRYVTHFGSYLSAVLRIEVAMITGTSPGPLKQSGVLYFKLPVGTAGGSALPGN